MMKQNLACRRAVSAILAAALVCVFAQPAYPYAAILNKADHIEIRIVPAPGKVAIDGDLKDWDLSGAILMFIDEASKDAYSVRGAMMYDKEYLYISGRVKDPTPMINNYHFGGAVNGSWNADAIQIRFVSDPEIRSGALTMTGARMGAEEQKFVNHITLWYSTQDKKAGYYAMYTLGYKDPVLNPAGVQAAYRKDADGKGTLYAVSGNSLGRVDLTTGAFTPIAKDLDEPRMLACDAAGNVYVSLRGKTMQVWKLDSRGKALQKFGKAGGRPALGKFDPAGMLKPYAIAVDKNGRLWVCEADREPKRYSVWNADGTLWKDFYGSLPYSTAGYPDPEKPEHFYAMSVRYVVDYDKGTWRPDATILRDRTEEGVPMASVSIHGGARIVVHQGRKFLLTGGRARAISTKRPAHSGCRAWPCTNVVPCSGSTATTTARCRPGRTCPAAPGSATAGKPPLTAA